ncbi:hypothetical protein FJY69_01775 [candidate division WOR-3 bacterium]|nr:hypothetical protein [candidate division WOR-3 bacterium]
MSAGHDRNWGHDRNVRRFGSGPRTNQNTGRLAKVLIKTLSALALVWGFWEMLSTTATLVRGLSRT